MDEVVRVQGLETQRATKGGPVGLGIPLLSVRDLTVEYATSEGWLPAVEDVSFDLQSGEFLSIVGESGCGKSTLLFAVAQLLEPGVAQVRGTVLYGGRDMVQLSERELRAIRWKNYSVVMQSAMNALNPVKTIGSQFRDALRAHGWKDAGANEERSREVLQLVRIDAAHLKSYPHQLSGGMRQRAMIAMALLFTPDLIIMDEPTSGLDVVAQRAMMLQIRELQSRFGFAAIFVTHDMSLVAHFSERVLVMYAGQVVEQATTQALLETPLHPYSKALLEAFPSLSGPRVRLKGIPGAPPALDGMPVGCRFAPRCAEEFAECRGTAPQAYRCGESLVRCLLQRGGDVSRD